MKRLILVITLLFMLSGVSLAQYSETIQTSRPGQAFIPNTTGTHVFQIQSGVTYSDFDNSDINQEGNSTDFFTLFRYGLLEDFEIRSTLGFSSSELRLDDNTNLEAGGLSAWSIGVRYNIFSGKGSDPSFGFQTDINLNWVDEDFKSEDIAPTVTLLHSQQLSKTFALTTNWSLSWNGDDSSTAGNYVINISFPLSDRLGSFIENYGTISNGDLVNRWDTGLGYLVHDNLILDCSFGYGSNDGLSDWFIDAGISWRTELK